jgi:hypothetical protein
MQPYTSFVLWDQETRNLLLDTTNEAEALAFVRETIAAFDEATILHWALFGEDGSDNDQSATLIAQGFQLAAYASGQTAASLTSA